MEDPCHSDCWTAVFTHSYCCVEGSPCWRWGLAAVGPVVRNDVARSGEECRYLCQAEPACSEWTFHLPDERVGADDVAPCVLHGASATGHGGDGAAQRAVSGGRFCQAPGEASQLAFAAATAETLDSEPWREHIVLHDDPDAAEHIAAALLESGFAVLRGGVPDELTAALGLAAAAQAEAMLQLDPPRLGNRGPRRYSFGGASKTHHMAHVEAWAALIDLPALRPVLQQAFNKSYVAVGGGGDFVLGQTDTHQRLHVDLQLPDMYSRAWPPAAIVANAVVGPLGCEDGPMRLVPRSQLLPLALAEEASRGEAMARLSSLEKEPILRSRLGLPSVLACPLRPGDLLLRDMRLWHGGTPNRGAAARYLPSAEFLSSWYADLTVGTGDHFEPRPALPFELWAAMSEHGRQVTRSILSVPGKVDSGIKVPFALMLPYVAENRP